MIKEDLKARAREFLQETPSILGEVYREIVQQLEKLNKRKEVNSDEKD